MARIEPAQRVLIVLFAVLVSAAACRDHGQADNDSPVDHETADSGAPADSDSTSDSQDSTTDPDPYVQPETWVEPLVLVPGSTATVHYGGGLKDAPYLNLLYGYNGWNYVDGVKGLVDNGATHGNVDWSVAVRMTQVQGGFESTIPIPEGARSLHFMFFYDETVPDPDTSDTAAWDTVRHADGNADQEYHREVAAFPYIGPVLTWNDQTSPDNGVVVNFETGVTCLATLEWGQAKSLGSSVLGSEPAAIHHIPLQGLDPDTTYYYRVRDNVGHVSDTFTFHTRPSAFSSFSFVAFSDIQDSGEDGRWEETAADLLAGHSGVDFWLIAGDMPDSDVPGQWWRFFDVGRDLFESVPVLPMIGNHDTPGVMHSTDNADWKKYFALPTGSGDSTFYRQDYGNATFLALNSEVPEDFASGGRQSTWIAGQLASLRHGADRKTWIFAGDHVPPYDAGDRHDVEEGTYRPVTACFDGAVDWMISGHEHLAQRFVPVRYDGRAADSGAWGQGDADGVGYLVLPPAGVFPNDDLVHEDAPEASVRELLDFPTVTTGDLHVASENGFTRFDIVDRTVTITTWGTGNHITPLEPHVRDALTYTKP
jgi:hypothetical protein